MPRNSVMLAFLNSCTTEGMSGGDVRFVEIAKRLPKYHKAVVTPLLGKRICERRELNAEYLITTTEKHVQNVLLTYLKRIIKALSMKIEIQSGDILYSTSDFLPDIFPAFIHKLRNKDVKWISAVYLLVPSLFKDFNDFFVKDSFSLPDKERSLYFVGQKVSLSLMKHFSDAVLVLNTRDKNYLVRALHFAKNKVFSVTMGVDNREIGKTKTERKIYDGAFVGRFHPQKGIFDLIRIWKLVCLEKPNARLALIGSGPGNFARKVVSEIEKEKLNRNIELLGFKDGEDKTNVLKSSKVFLFPSVYESWGGVAIEAMASGLPVVAYDLPIFKGIFPRGMTTVPIGNTQEFANRVLNLLNDQYSYEKMCKEALGMASKYDWDNVANEESELLESLFDDRVRSLCFGKTTSQVFFLS